MGLGKNAFAALASARLAYAVRRKSTVTKSGIYGASFYGFHGKILRTRKQKTSRTTRKAVRLYCGPRKTGNGLSNQTDCGFAVTHIPQVLRGVTAVNDNFAAHFGCVTAISVSVASHNADCLNKLGVLAACARSRLSDNLTTRAVYPSRARRRNRVSGTPMRVNGVRSIAKIGGLGFESDDRRRRDV